MRAYEALSKGDTALAIDLSSKLESMNQNIAAPHIITGLSYLRLNDKEKARLSFLKGKKP